jgi:uncharacterized protein (DUF697 family)
MTEAEAEAATSPSIADEAPAHHPNETHAKREADALATVKRFSAWTAFGGLIPLPFVDVVAVAGLQLQMLRRLAAIYGIPFSDNAGKSVIASLIGGSFPTSTAMGVASTVKAVPVVGSAIGVVMAPSLAAGSTWIIGKVFMRHFASGGTLLDFEAPDYREFVRGQASAMGSRFSRAKPVQDAGGNPG